MKHIKTAYPLYLIGLLAVLFLAPVLFHPCFYCYRDILLYEYGDRKSLVDAYLNGDILLWFPYRFCGTPYLANIAKGCFHPFHILFFFFSFHLGFKLFILLSLWLAGYGMYAWLRLWKLQRLSALLSALGFMLSGILLGSIPNFCYFLSYVWIPAVFAVFHLAIARTSWPWLIATAFMSTFQLFSGDPQSWVITNVLLFPYYFLIRKTTNWKTSLLHAVGIFTVLVILIAALGAIQILPTWELWQNSNRKSGLNFEEVTKWSLTLIQCLQFFCPAPQGYPTIAWFGGTAENIPFLSSVFVGTAVLFLLGTGLLLPGGRLKWFAVIGALGFLLLSWGDNLPLYQYVWQYIPFFNSFRYPSKYMIFVFFFIYTMVGIHFEKLFWSWEETWSSYRTQIITGLAIVICCHLVVYFILILPPDFQNMISNKVGIKKLQFSVLFAPDAPAQMLRVGVLLGLLIAVWFILIRNRTTRLFLASLIVAAIAGQMIWEGWKLNPTIPETFYTQPGWGEQRLAQVSIGLSRYYNSRPKFKQEKTAEGRDVLIENPKDISDRAHSSKSCMMGYYQAYGYDAIRPFRINSLHKKNPLFPCLYLSSAEYLFLWQHEYPKEENPYFILEREGSVLFCKNTQCVPRLWFPPRIHFVAGMQEAVELSYIGWNQLNCLDTAYIEGFPKNTLEYAKDSQSTARFLTYSHHKIEIDATTDRERWLILNDSFYPGWQCSIDGLQAKIYPANVAFRAVLVPEGKHRISFRYRPFLFYLGLAISGTACLLSIVGLAGLLYRNHQARS